MFPNRSVVLLCVLLGLYAAVSFWLKRKQRALGLEPGSRTKSAIWVGIFWVNAPVFLILLGPLLFQLTFFKGVAPAWSISLLMLGFMGAWMWWSVKVSLWRRWADRRGTDPHELQMEGESSSILWPKGHFFERTELGQIVRRFRHDN